MIAVANVSVGGEVSESSQMGSSKVMYWPPRSSPSSYQQYEAFRDMGDGVYIQSRQNAILYQSKDQDMILMRELLFADIYI